MMYPEVPAFYTLIHVISGHYYIGSTSDLYLRINNHRSQLNLNKHQNNKLQSVYTSWGHMEVTFIQTESIEKAKQLEQEYLNRHFEDELCCNLYNQAFGTFLKGTMPDIFANRLRTMNFGRVITKDRTDRVREVHKGRVVRPETRAALRIALLNRPDEDSYPKEVIIDGILYKSLSAASRALGVAQPTVKNRVNSKHPRYYTWRWASESRPGSQ